MDLGSDNLERIGSNRDASEFKTRLFALELPRLSIHVENSVTQKVTKNNRERFAFRVIVKPGFENVFNVFRVGRDSVAEDMNVNSPSRRFSEKMRVPITQIAKLFSPTQRQVTSTNLAVTARLKPQDEEQQRKQREKDGEREEQNAKSIGHGLHKQ